MNNFDRQWQHCAAHARQVPPREAEAPFGFATRVLANVGRPAHGPAPLLLWERLGLRALAGVAVLLTLLGVLEYRDSQPRGLAIPGVEHCVAQAFWML